MWVPDEGCLTGTPSLPTYGVPSLTPAFDGTIYNFPISWMTTGQMTCASGADDGFLPPFRKLRFQMINNNQRARTALAAGNEPEGSLHRPCLLCRGVRRLIPAARSRQVLVIPSRTPKKRQQDRQDGRHRPAAFSSRYIELDHLSWNSRCPKR